MIYAITRTEVIEVASEILGCSMDRIRVRTRMLRGGASLPKRDGYLYLIMSMNNNYQYLKSVDSNRDEIIRTYKNDKFKFNGNGVWMPDGLSFFCDEVVKSPTGGVYLEISVI